MSTFERCNVCGAPCTNGWQILCGLCEECSKRDENWKKLEVEDNEQRA